MAGSVFFYLEVAKQIQDSFVGPCVRVRQTPDGGQHCHRPAICESGAALGTRDVLEKLICGANRIRRFITCRRVHDTQAGKLTAAVDHAYSMAEYARVWAERASSIVDAPRPEACQQQGTGKKSLCCCVVVVTFSKAVSYQTAPF